MSKKKLKQAYDNSSVDESEQWNFDQYQKGPTKETDLSFEDLLNDSLDLEEKKVYNILFCC